jgi:hypothetical protein
MFSLRNISSNSIFDDNSTFEMISHKSFSYKKNSIFIFQVWKLLPLSFSMLWTSKLHARLWLEQCLKIHLKVITMTCNSNSLIYSLWALQPTFKSHKLLQTLWSTFEFWPIRKYYVNIPCRSPCRSWVHSQLGYTKGKKKSFQNHIEPQLSLGCFMTNMISYKLYCVLLLSRRVYWN